MPAMRKIQTKKGHDPYAALRSPSFRLFLIGNSLVFLCIPIVPMAVGWELYSRTHSALDLGLMGFFAFLPFLLFGMLGGNVADRYDRRRVTLASNFLFILGVLGLALVSHFQDRLDHFNYWVFGCLFLMGTSNAFYIPAKQALLSQLVPRETLLNAVTWNSALFQFASVMGPFLGGFLMKTLPFPVIYALVALLESIFVLILLFIRPEQRPLSKGPITLKSLLEGARFVHKTKPILATITMDLFAVLLGGCTALLPIFVKDILKGDEGTLGLLRGAPAAGAVLMALLISRRPLKRPGVTLLWAVAGFGAATIVFGLSRSLWLSMAMMFLIGALDEISVIIRGTLVQVLTPNRLLGRVQGVNYLFIYSSNELGAFESGTVAALIGAVPSVVLGGIGSIVVVLGVTYLWPQVAQLKSLHRAK